MTALEAWLREQCAQLSNSSVVAKPIDYMLHRWDRFTRFVDDERICLTTDGVEKSLPSVRSNRFLVLLPGRHHAFVGLLDWCDLDLAPQT
ncbi:hypothetical protein XI04_03705 [Bradyrhizobium sp. CCBAU 11430]|nr:hypothetical protein [Bradyrhizobium sp. CCBAU 11430]